MEKIPSQNQENISHVLSYNPERVKNNIEIIYQKLFEDYKEMHTNPEFGGEEFETSKLIQKRLNELGIEILANDIDGTGVVAEIIGNEDGPTIALRADMDALALTENPEHEIKSNIEGKMHACGHDIHVTSLLGAAEILKGMAENDELGGRVILLFQPNEDKAVHRKSGAASMAKYLEKEGLRERIKAFYALHVIGSMERGTVLLADRLQYAGANAVELKLKTLGGHGSDIRVLPDIDYLLSDIKVKIADELSDYWDKGEAVIDSMAPKVSNDADNIVLSEGSRVWILRIISEDYKKITNDVRVKIKRIINESISKHKEKFSQRAEKHPHKKTPENYEIEMELKLIPNTRPTVHRNQDLVDISDRVANGILKNYKRITEGVLGTDDFSFLLEELRGKEIPGTYMAVGGASKVKGLIGQHHSPDFKVDPESIKDLTAIHVGNVLESINHFKNKV